MPANVPEVPELGVTSAPLKSASFFIGEHCKAFNGAPLPLSLPGVSRNLTPLCTPAEDFMLCKAENRDPAHCLKEGRKVTRCAQDLCVLPSRVGPKRGVPLADSLESAFQTNPTRVSENTCDFQDRQGPVDVLARV